MDNDNNTNMPSYAKLIEDLEKQCTKLSKPINNRMGWRVLRAISKKMSNTEIDQNMAELGMNFFDQLSIYYHGREYDDIMIGFEDYLDEAIKAEIKNLTEVERLILEHTSFGDLREGLMDAWIFIDLKNEISSILNQHYYTTRIQRFVDKYDLQV